MTEQTTPDAPEEERIPENDPSPTSRQADVQPQSEEPKKPEKIKKKSELEKLQDDFAALNDKHLRLAAEYDNFRKRTQRERDSIYPDATAAAATQFLAVADNFERALCAPCTDAEYKKGAEMTYKSLVDALEKLGVAAFGEAGEPFDPTRHNAVMHIEDETVEASTIVEVFQRGYCVGDRILRPAMVKVAN